ncbi:MAG: insulinase family protein, partial [Chitinophagaceae bacterium]|nr:insulinase family protein [Chitinophagaceae bacterium]
MINRTIAPPIKDAIDFNLYLKQYEKFILDNGVEVYSINAGNEEVVQLEWVFYAGNWYEEQNLIAASANHLLKNGTSSKTAFQLNEHFEYYGSYLNRNCYNETANITLHSLNKHLDALLPVVQELLTDSVFSEEELAIYKQNNKQRLAVNLKKAEFVANRFIDSYLYGEQHPYGKYSSAEAFDAVEREQLLQFYNRYYKEGKCIIFVSGKLPAGINEQLNTYFGKLPLNQKSLPVILHPVKSADEKKYRVNNDANGVQGSIRLASHFPNRHHPDFIKSQVLNTVFGGFFGSRLMSNIREEKGYTYGIHSYLKNHIQQSAFMISTEAGKDVCEATLVEIYKEMEDLREEPVDDEELLLVKNYMIGGVIGELDGPFQIMSRWKNIILNDLDEQYFYRSIDTIKKVEAEELREL